MHQKRLGDMASYVNGYAFKPEQRGKVGLPIIRIQDLTGNVYDLGFYDGDYPKKVEINDGDVLISWSASLGVYEWNRGKALLNQHIFKVVFDKLTVDKKFFMYAVKYKLEEMESKAHGATMKHITKKDFDNTVISFPTIVEQERISNTLNKLHTIIDSKKFQLEKLDNLIKARFVEMFGDKDFEKKPFKDVCEELFAGGDVKRDRTVKDADSNHSYPVFTNGEKDGGLYGYTDVARVTKPSITISGRGTIGFCLVRAEPFYPAIRLIVAIPKENLVTPSYLKYFIDSKDYSGSGASIPQLTIPMIKDEPVPIPPIKIQKEFESIVTQVDKSKFTLQNNIISLMNLWYNINQYVCERTYGEA